MNTAEYTERLQYLTFRMDQETFALEIIKIREILEVRTITRVPQTPDYMCGVINLRGSVVPIIDLRFKFGMGQTGQTQNTCIIILEVDIDGTTSVIGSLADSVQEVIELDTSVIEPSPKIGTHLNTKFLKGIGKVDHKFMMILDIDKVFSAEEFHHVQNVFVQPSDEKNTSNDENDQRG